jgi:hypothetical protein
MRNLWKLGALSAVCGAVLGLGGGCQDFDAAYEACKNEGRCEPSTSGDGGDGGPADGGDAGPVDAGPEPEPACTKESETDEPDPEGKDSNCDGVDGVASAGYFVDPERGEVGATGDQFHPLRTLGEALQRVASEGAATGRTHIYLGVGTYNESETIVTTPVSIHGGYRWYGPIGPDVRYWSRFKSPTPTLINGGTLAVTVRGVTDPGVLLDSVNIFSADGLDGGASIALRAVDTSLRIYNAHLEAGNGGQGRSGQQGQSGNMGFDGPEGSMGEENRGGSGGRPIDERGCFDGTSLGGGGGSGDTGRAGLTGEVGTPGNTPGGPGGARKDAGCEVATCFCEGWGGDAGVAGNTGDAGINGDAGFGFGLLTSTAEWQSNQQGVEGTSGKLGGGGGGGGGGGSCNVTTNKVAAGSGGGAGGTGGCGGFGGQAGEGGGASIALLLKHSTATLSNGTRLVAHRGGQGGAGGPGGLGGEGGRGGVGGPFTNSVQGTDSTLPTRKINTTGGQGGPGGNGGAGGRGGWGGGAGGGPSIGIWCDDAGVTWNPMTVTITQGLGGPGGQSDGGVNGAEGVSLRDLNCTFVDAGTP